MEEKLINLINTLIDIKAKIALSKENQSKCREDLFYWHYVNEEIGLLNERDNLIKEVINQFNDLDVGFRVITDFDYNNTSAKVDKLNDILEDKNRIIKELKLYKPSGYKKTIETLNRIFEKYKY